jgi:glycosyltransferase involved in cell wall biosynthesis
VILSVVIISYNEEANIGRTLARVQPLVCDGKGEIIVVDSGSTDRTVEIAKSYGAKVFVEEWKGYAAQKNSAIEKASGKWILSLDADEEVSQELAAEIRYLLMPTPEDSADWIERLKRIKYVATRGSFREMKARAKQAGAPTDSLFAQVTGYSIRRKNFFLNRWIKHGGFWPDPKLRLFQRGMARFEDRLVHEDVQLATGISGRLRHALIHHSYPTFSDYIAHMNRYSSLGAEMVVAKGKRHFLVLDIVFRHLLTFLYNYFFRLGFLDGREGFLLHVGHAIYVSWKYMKVWELQHGKRE